MTLAYSRYPINKWQSLWLHSRESLSAHLSPASLPLTGLRLEILPLQISSLG